MSGRDRFSTRYGHTRTKSEITIREDAPSEVRAAVLHIASELDLAPSTLREIICRVLKVFPDRNNWSEYPNIWDEVQRHIEDCEWFQVYDIAEAIYDHLAKSDPSKAQEYQEKMNEHFRSEGVGWQFINGTLETRGSEAFEATVRQTTSLLSAKGRPTAAQEIHEALRDLSRRPEPDITGAVQHAMAALECVARDLCGNPKATLGEVLKRNPGLLPKPLDDAAEKLWGYASEKGRHLREGHPPKREEADLVVGIAATLATYLVKKKGST